MDEYLQATLFTVERDHIAISMRLTPGLEVLAKVLTAIDTSGDGVVSNAKQQAYAEKVRRDLSLSIDGSLPAVATRGFLIPNPGGDEARTRRNRAPLRTCRYRREARRRLVFENHHLPTISVYMANCLVPSDPASA